MKTNRRTSLVALAAVIVAMTVAHPAWLRAQTGPAKSSAGSKGSDAASQWSVQVDKTDPGDENLAPSFQMAIYENLLDELSKMKQFEHVLRDGDRNANRVTDLLILKTIVQKYVAGSETRRAVTTVSGATKLTVRSLLCARDGKVVVERTVNGNVRLFGSNLRATHNLARNVAKSIKESSLPSPPHPASIQTSELLTTMNDVAALRHDQLRTEEEGNVWQETYATSNSTVGLSLVAATILAVTVFAVEAKGQVSQEAQSALKAPLEPLRAGVAENQLFAALDAHNELRKSALLGYTALRTYQVVDSKGKVHAEEIGQMEFRAPDKKTFTVTSESGSEMIRHMALNRLISSEMEAVAGKEHRDSALSRENYSLDLLGEQQVGPYHCFVAQATPKRKDKYLFEGKLWIDVNDYAVVRIEGHPAKKLSFWIQRADFVRQYQKIDGFWLPEKDQTLVQVRLYGKKILKIEHRNYVVNAGQSTNAWSIVPETSVTEIN